MSVAEPLVLREVRPRTLPAAVSGRESGLFRTLLAGVGGSLTQAFRALRDSPRLSNPFEHPARDAFAGTLEGDLGCASGHYELMQFGAGLYLAIENLIDTGPRYELAPGEGMLSFHVRLAGEYMTRTGADGDVRFTGPHLGAKFHPRGVVTPLWFPAQPRALALTIWCTPEFLAAQVLGGAALSKQLARLLDASAPDVNYCRLPVTAEILTCATQLIECKISGPPRLSYAEAKVTELLCLALAAFERLDESAVEQFSETDVRRFHRAREILATRFNPPPTITEIARELAMNETKLKSGFKALFRQTVFDYGLECRMRHALHLLRDKRLRISVVSEAVGYQHQGTFASAFKAYFGIRPKDIRKPPSAPPPAGGAVAARVRHAPVPLEA